MLALNESPFVKVASTIATLEVLKMNSSHRISFLVLACISCGCSAINSVGGSSVTKVPQSQEMTWATPLRLKIEHCSWTRTVSRSDDFPGQAGSLPPQIQDAYKLNAQDNFLVVELAMTNYGTEPLHPLSYPMFELRNAAGIRYQPTLNMDRFTTDFVLAGNINPGRAEKGRVVFDVPKGQYDLYVNNSRLQGSVVRPTGQLMWIWELSPAEGN